MKAGQRSPHRKGWRFWIPQLLTVIAAALLCFFGGYWFHRRQGLAIFCLLTGIGMVILWIRNFRRMILGILKRNRIIMSAFARIPFFQEQLNGLSSEGQATQLEMLFYGINELQLCEIMEEAAGKLSESYDKEESLKYYQIQAQINALYNQINPHFLYNALEVLRSYASQSGAYKAAEMAEALSSLFRYNVGKAEDISTFSSEIESVKNYFVIQQYRYRDRFSLECLFDPQDPELMDCQMPRLSLEPIVENAIRHGLEPKSGKGKVSIRAYITQEDLCIRVMDNGVGISNETMEEMNHKFMLGLAYTASGSDPNAKSTQVGLININQRLKLYYGEQYGISVSGSPGMGMLVQMTLPRSYRKNLGYGKHIEDVSAFEATRGAHHSSPLLL